MKSSEMIKRIEKAGYKFSALTSGIYMAKKGFEIYKAESIYKLYCVIFD